MARKLDIRKMTYKEFIKKFQVGSAYWGVSKKKDFYVTDKRSNHLYASGGVKPKGRGVYVVGVGYNEFGKRGTVTVDMGSKYRLTPNTIGRVVYYALLRLV